MRLNHPCPDLVAQSHKRRFSLRGALKGRWGVVMFHPAAFTPVCSTEVTRMTELMMDSVTGLQAFSVVPDKLSVTPKWVAELSARAPMGIRHDCISDQTHEIAHAFGFTDQEIDEKLVRGYFIFDPTGRLRSCTVLPREVGFSSDELVRVVTALQLVDTSDRLAPVDWRPGLRLLSSVS